MCMFVCLSVCLSVVCEKVRSVSVCVLTSMLTAYSTPYSTLVHQGKGTKYQDKQHISWAASQSYTAAAALYKPPLAYQSMYVT